MGKAAQLPATLETNELRELLAKDAHLKPFLRLPAKENGFDIEGVAVSGERMFLGLRGPVLRGWSMLLELEVKRKDGGLKLKTNGPNDRRYRKRARPGAHGDPSRPGRGSRRRHRADRRASEGAAYGL